MSPYINAGMHKLQRAECQVKANCSFLPGMSSAKKNLKQLSLNVESTERKTYLAHLSAFLQTCLKASPSLQLGKWGGGKLISGDGNMSKHLTALRKSFVEKLSEKEPGAIHETMFDRSGGAVQVLGAVTPARIQRLAKDAVILVYAANLITVRCNSQTPKYK